MASTPLVFLLHGIGHQPPGWHGSFVDALDSAIDAHSYARLHQLRGQSGTIADVMQLVPIDYGQYFAALIHSWQDQSTQALAISSPAVKPKVERAVGWLTESEMNQNEFVWSHLLDAFLWITNSNLRNAIKNFVADTITSTILARREAGRFDRFKTCLVGYSLGTAVAHHTLQDMASGAWTGHNGFAPSWFRFDTIHTVANISRLLAFDPDYDVYEGFVRPGPYGNPGSYTFNFFDYRHPLDPFTLPAPFVPTTWPANLFDAHTPSHVHQVNVHALEHYVAHPAVHIRMLRDWFGYGCISAKEELEALNSLPMFSAEDDFGASETFTQVQSLASSIQQTVGSATDLVDILKGIALIALTYEQR